MKKRSGLTVIELMVAVAISGIVLVSITQLMNIIKKGSLKAEQRIEAESTSLLGERQIWFDARLAFPSFGNVALADDDGKEFFDYVSDSNCGLSAACKRNLTLKKGGQAVLPLIVTDDTPLPDTCHSGSPLVNPTAQLIRPIEAYDAVPGPSFAVGGTLTYNGSRLKSAMNGNCAWSSYWRDDSDIMFMMPAYVRKIISGPGGDTVDMIGPTRALSFFGKIERGGVNVPLETFGQITRLDDPLRSSIQINSLDEFFRRLGPMGGGVYLASFRPVRAVRYQIEGHHDEGYTQETGALTRQTWDAANARWGKSQVIAAPVKQVVFSRKNISLPVIDVRIDFDKRDIK